LSGFLVPSNRNELVILSLKGFHWKASGGGEGHTNWWGDRRYGRVNGQQPGTSRGSRNYTQ